MLQGANSTSKAVAKTKLANIKSKNARASLANITMLFPPDTTWRRGWSYVQHLLHNCAMRVRAHFKNIDEVIAAIKAATIKNKDRKKDFHDAGLPSPPDPIITRWATWLRAALYYSENLPAVRTIVNNWTSAGLLVSRAKDAINVEGLVSDLVKINQYRTLAANVEFLEGSACTITKAYGLLKNMQCDDDPCAIKDYINKRLS